LISAADQHLLSLIRGGDADGWSQFIDRFQKRLIAFAYRQVDQHATAEDLVQETFVSFLKTIDRFREDCELETFLFQILRRRIVDQYRVRGKLREIPACSYHRSESERRNEDPLTSAVSPDDEAGDCVRDQESIDEDYRGLYEAIRIVAGRLRQQRKFRDLKIAEGIFYAGMPNRDLAMLLDCDPNEIAVVKHRLLSKLAQATRQAIERDASDPGGSSTQGDLLTMVWEAQRPSCPKRTTLGKYVLDILTDDWRDYVDFHLHHLGCLFCSANLAELTEHRLEKVDSQSSARLFQSTIGFFNSLS
jgi:RNA polymerase sigma factor (sigma-70 family)